jgi:1,4-dihydroxy-2-naphthoate octaprenyltransferase
VALAASASPLPASLAVVRAFVRLGRPKFLLGGFALYGLGAALAAAAGVDFDGRRFVIGQLCVTAAQLGTHYANDYFDLAADRANRTPTSWSGGSRILAEGILPAGVALRAAVVLFGAAVGFAFALAASIPSAGLTLPIAATMIALAWTYSAPPVRLVASGWGELGTALTVSGCVPVLGFYLQARALRPAIFAAVALPAALQFAMLLAIGFPDAAGDAATGKRTLVVRLGGTAAARLYAAVTLAGFAALPLAAAAGAPTGLAVAPLALLPVAVWQSVRVVRGAYGDPARWESVAFWSVALLGGSAVAELAAVLASTGG